MPLVKRTVEPTHISRVVIEKSIHDELECVGNSALANVIRQLSSLSAHAEDLFTELYHETCYSFSRMAQLNDRVDRLKIKITELNHTVEEVSLQDINMRKPFRSSVIKDQQIVTIDSRPVAVSVSYQQCDAAPPLHKLNVFREDGKDSLKFYTDPGHFFELWCEQMMAKDAELLTKKQRQRHRKPRQNKPSTIRVPKSRGDELSAMRHGPELHDALKKSQSVEPKLTNEVAAGNRLSAVEAQPAARHTQSTHIPDYRDSVHMNNGYPAIPTAQQHPHGLGVIQQQNVISDSGYWSPKNNNIADYQVPTTKQPNLQHSVSIAARPMMPPPAPPPPATEIPQLMADRDRLAQDSGYPVARPTSGVSTALPARTMPDRTSLPPPPPAPPPVLAPQQSAANQHSLQRQATPPTELDAFDVHAECDLPLPPMPPPCDDVPAGPPSPGFPAVPASYPPADALAESPLPLPPDDVAFNMMVVPPPPPPLMEPEQTTTKLGGSEVNSSGIGDKDWLQPDTASVSSEASSLATKSVNEDTGSEAATVPEPAPVRDKRSDLLDAIRKGIQLRKVEEHRQQSERKKQTYGKPDVQTIMEAAFEQRRRAIEENDSDRDDDDDDDGDWGDD